MEKAESYEIKKENFIQMLMSVDKDQLSTFIKTKGHEPKKIKPFICLNMDTSKK